MKNVLRPSVIMAIIMTVFFVGGCVTTGTAQDLKKAPASVVDNQKRDIDNKIANIDKLMESYKNIAENLLNTPTVTQYQKLLQDPVVNEFLTAVNNYNNLARQKAQLVQAPKK